MMCKTNKVMKIYLATPVNGRKEKTMRDKQHAALKRIEEMKSYLRGKFVGANFMSVFDYVEPDVILSEPCIMGHCVQLVMECDMIVLDDGWENSSGCTVERFVAMQYGKKVQTMNYFKMMDKIG